MVKSQHEALIKSSVELGHEFLEDAYSGNNAGVFFSLTSQNDGVRETSEFAYR
jgi:hypothetical protein